MKYCPYCGASLLGSTVFFCSECGKSLPKTEQKPEQSDIVQQADPDLAIANQADSVSGGATQLLEKESKKRIRRQKPVKTKKASKRSPVQENEPEVPPIPDPQDEGYDGYYDDILPTDEGHTKEGLDPELIKRIIMVAAGALVIVCLSIAVMYIL